MPDRPAMPERGQPAEWVPLLPRQPEIREPQPRIPSNQDNIDNPIADQRRPIDELLEIAERLEIPEIQPAE